MWTRRRLVAAALFTVLFAAFAGLSSSQRSDAGLAAAAVVLHERVVDVGPVPVEIVDDSANLTPRSQAVGAPPADVLRAALLAQELIARPPLGPAQLEIAAPVEELLPLQASSLQTEPLRV